MLVAVAVITLGWLAFFALSILIFYPEAVWLLRRPREIPTYPNLCIHPDGDRPHEEQGLE